MSDIVQRLRERLNLRYMSDCKCGKCQLVHGDDVAEAADEIERLREALKRLAELDEFVCGKPQTIEEVMNYTQFVARAALGEK